VSEQFFQEEEFSTQFNGKTILRILQQALPHWPFLLCFLLSIAIVSGLESYFTFLSKQIIDEGIIGKDFVVLSRVLIRYGLLMFLQAGAVFGFIYFAGMLGERIAYDLRKSLFNQLQELSLTYFNKTPVGWIMSRVTSDTSRISELATWGLLDTTWAIMNIGTAIFFMLIINWRMALIVLLAIPVLVVISARFKERILIEYRKVRKINSTITGAYNENITGVRVVKALVREKQNLKDFSVITGAMYAASFRAKWLSALFLPVVQLISAVSLGVVISYSGLQVQAGLLTIGGIHAFISYITFMLWPVQDLARVYAEMQQSIASAERVFSLIDANPDIMDKEESTDISSIIGDIKFDNVSFQYEEDKPVLRDFSLDVIQGETIALVGPTGGGKTTIVNLLCRFFEPTQGSIHIAGYDYTDLTLHTIQSRIGIVLQTPHLFSGSIRENIRYGKLDATNEEIEAAAAIAGAHSFILKLENGYEEDVGEGGNRLSGGQKQLISLSRAVLSEPEIFIMDEATSSVDTLTEELIQRGMDALMIGRTSFIIAHRLSTIKRADRILYIQDGQIVESGNHAELIRKHGLYYRLYTSQYRENLEQSYSPYDMARQSTDS